MDKDQLEELESNVSSLTGTVGRLQKLIYLLIVLIICTMAYLWWHNRIQETEGKQLPKIESSIF